MPKITFIKHNGDAESIDIPIGLTVMEGAVKNNVGGINGDCGGSCVCATCHVYVDSEWQMRLPPKDDSELAMLELAAEPASNSRLSCQIKVIEALDGMIVRLPESQY